MNLKLILIFTIINFRVEQITSVRLTAKRDKKAEKPAEKHFKPLNEFIEVYFVFHSLNSIIIFVFRKIQKVVIALFA